MVNGTLRLKQGEFGIQPVSVAGLVKVKNERALEVEIVAVAAGEPVAGPAGSGGEQ